MKRLEGGTCASSFWKYFLFGTQALEIEFGLKTLVLGPILGNTMESMESSF